jgi:hypothetical protein
MKLSVQAREESGAVQVSAMMAPLETSSFRCVGLARQSQEGARPMLGCGRAGRGKGRGQGLAIARGLLEAPTRERDLLAVWNHRPKLWSRSAPQARADLALHQRGR